MMQYRFSSGAHRAMDGIWGVLFFFFCSCLWLLRDFRLVFFPLFPHFRLFKNEGSAGT